MDKRLVDKSLTLLGLFGGLPNDDKANLLRASLPVDKETRMGNIIAPRIAHGQILRSELGELIGRFLLSNRHLRQVRPRNYAPII